MTNYITLLVKEKSVIAYLPLPIFPCSFSFQSQKYLHRHRDARCGFQYAGNISKIRLVYMY